MGAMLWALALLAPFSVIASDLPRIWAWPLASLAAAWAIFDARRYRAMPSQRIVVPAGRGAATCDEARIEELQVHWRGPLAFLHWRDAAGKRRRVAFWPDTLAVGTRRELKLALQRREAATGTAKVAG